MKNFNPKQFFKWMLFAFFMDVAIILILILNAVGTSGKYSGMIELNKAFFAFSKVFLSEIPFELRASFNNSFTKNYTLFYIERNNNVNKIYYDVNLNATGKLNIVNPIDVYWIKYENGAKKIPINWVQKTFAYGLKIISSSGNEAVFQFVSYEKRNFQLKKDYSGKFKVFTISLGKYIEVSRLFIHVSGGTTRVPIISKIELYGKDMRTGINTIEIITF